MPAKTVIQGIPMSHIAIGLSVICFLYVIPAIVNPKKFRDTMDGFFKSDDALIRLAAFGHLLIAFFILNTHWTIKLSSSRSIMTVIGYLLLLRGIIWFWFPGWVKGVARKWLQKESMIYVAIFLGVLFAAGLGYLGIWVY